MSNAFCSVESCPVAVPHTHPTPEQADDMRVMITIRPEMVDGHLWNGDETSRYAIAMDTDKGGIVWHRSRDWAMYGRMNGWTRVARIADDN